MLGILLSLHLVSDGGSLLAIEIPVDYVKVDRILLNYMSLILNNKEKDMRGLVVILNLLYAHSEDPRVRAAVARIHSAVVKDQDVDIMPTLDTIVNNMEALIVFGGEEITRQYHFKTRQVVMEFRDLLKELSKL